MVSLSDLWLIILAAAALSWIGSAIVWMVLPHHRSDYAALPREDDTIDSLRGVAPGFYNFPHCKTWEEFKQEEVRDKFRQGPVGYITVVKPGLPPMGRNMVMQVLYFLVTGVLIAYIVGRALPAGADYMSVFRLSGAVAWAAYGFAIIPEGIWYGRPWSNVIKFLADALFYALLTAGVFGWLWPAAV